MAKRNIESKGAIASLRQLFRSDKGVAAVEFGLFAPMLFLSLVSAADVGLALYERMTLDHILRAGAHTALTDSGEASVAASIDAAAAQQDFEISLSTTCPAPDGKLCRKIDAPSCECADGSSANCLSASTACPSGDYRKFYNFSATKTRENMLLPNMSFSSSMRVQVR